MRMRKHKNRVRPGDYKVRDDLTGFTYMRSECQYPRPTPESDEFLPFGEGSADDL
jgi:hypothetical protein